jgi:TatD DNase family protein
MNYLIDTHAHLYADQFKDDRKEMIERAFAQNVQKLFLPNIDLESIDGMLALEEEYPGQCYAMMGLHPCSVDANYVTVLDEMRAWLDKRPFVAVGEIGLDYYWSMEFVKEQKDAFRQQCRWAIELDLPIVIHARDSLDDLIQIVGEEKKDDRLRGIFHCFGGTLEQAQKIMDLGFWMGLGGVLTFKKANLGAVVEHIPLESLVLETDAPYLTPTPYRGKRNESAYVALVAEKLAEVKGITVDEVAEVTTANALEIFGV